MILLHPITRREIHAEACEWVSGGAYFRCPSTGFEWFYPQPSNVPVFPDFSEVAEAILQNPDAETILNAMPVNEIAALAWVEKNVRRGARIVELFAETGRFAWLLKDRGFEVYLADPLASHVSALSKKGFRAVQALSPSELPGDYVEPEAVIILESLVRLPDPLRYVESVRRRFPKASIYLTVPTMRRPLMILRSSSGVGYPPDFLTRWTKAALHLLLEEAGYKAHSKIIRPRFASEFSYKSWKNFLFWKLSSLFMWANGELEFSLAAWGSPRQDT
jgi:hypothetical protein